MSQSRARDQDLPLPPQLTPFVGRRQELADIGRLLAEEECRLLTLVGVGGVGKTRLAIEAARQARERFAQGAAFVPLQNVDSPAYLARAISDALQFSRRDTEDPWQQLLARLRDREMLLVLDNFEQLLDAAPRLTDLLQAAPGVRLLVTSREALRLQEEWRYPVQGLAAPESATASDWERHDALRLFADRARRVRPDFAMADELQGAVRLCLLVEGMPLAIEMAASWLRSATCEQIAGEIEGNLDLLTTTMRNVARRHRSLRAVFEHSWQQLADEEREVYARLSVFQGSFRRRAAAQVAGASLPLLSSFVDKSLLRWEPDGRYQMHALLRQYAAQQLQQAAGEAEAAHEGHSAYYAAFLQGRRTDLHGGRQREALAEIEAELDNIRAAWAWAVVHGDVEKLWQSAEALAVYYDFRGRYLEGVRALEAAVSVVEKGERTPRAERTLALLLANLGGLFIRLGRLEETEAVLERCEAVYERSGQPMAATYTGDPAFMLGIIASIRGDYDAAERMGRQALRDSEARNELLKQQAAHYLLGRAALLQGQAQAAEDRFQKSHELCRETGDRWFMAYSLNELGNVACAQGRYEQARESFKESYHIREAFEDPEGMAVALSNVGKVALLQEETGEAQRLYGEALAISREINNHGGEATALGGLGAAALAEGDYAAAQRHLVQALAIARRFQFVSLLLSLLVGAGELLARTGQRERGLALLAVVRRHPGSEHETRERARQALARLGVDEPPEGDAAGQPPPWEELARLARALQPPDAAEPDGEGSPERAGAPELVEPLTEREAEVLQLLAEGLSNAQIAERLVLAVGTVKYYTSEIYGKLGVDNRLQAVNRARELDLV